MKARLIAARESPACWALVTGASAGIGLEFCRQLAVCGVHLVMAARRERLLLELACELSARHKIETRVLSYDLTDPSAPGMMKKRLKAEGIRIRILCNNAGTGYWGRFSELPIDSQLQMIQLNVLCPVALCGHFLDDLMEQRPSSIINVSSQAAFQPTPYMTVYGATKASLHSFSLALHHELKSEGIYVQTLVPRPTKTELGDRVGGIPTVLQPLKSPQAIVSLALRHLRSQKPLVSNAPGILKQKLFAALAPTWLMLRVVAKIFDRPPGTGKEVGNPDSSNRRVSV